MTARVLSKEDQAEIVTRYRQGQSTVKLAARFYVSEASIRRILDSAGIGRRPVLARVGLDDAAIVGLVEDDGYSWGDLGQKLSISRGGAMRRYQRAKARLARVSVPDQSVTGT